MIDQRRDELARALRDVTTALERVVARLEDVSAALEGARGSPRDASGTPPPSRDAPTIDLSDGPTERDARVIAEELIGW